MSHFLQGVFQGVFHSDDTSSPCSMYKDYMSHNISCSSVQLLKLSLIWFAQRHMGYTEIWPHTCILSIEKRKLIMITPGSKACIFSIMISRQCSGGTCRVIGLDLYSSSGKITCMVVHLHITPSQQLTADETEVPSATGLPCWRWHRQAVTGPKRHRKV